MTEKMIEKIDKFLPSKKEKCNMIMTCLGCAAQQAEFILEKFNPKDVPLDVRYVIAITCANMRTFTSDHEEVQRIDFSYDIPERSEQGQEKLHRRLRRIVKTLYEHMLEEEKI